jgi:hypothetical protein
MNKLVQIGENEYRFDRAGTYLDEIEDEITHNGKKYIHTTRIEKPYTYADFWENNRGDWMLWEITELQAFGLPIYKVWGYRGFIRTDEYNLQFENYNYSTNEYVALIQLMEDEGIIPLKFIKGKESYGRDLDLFNEPNHLYINIYRYGFNNYLGVQLSFAEFLNVNFKMVDPDINAVISRNINHGILPHNIIEIGLLDDEQKLKIAMAVFKNYLYRKQCLSYPA